MKLPTYLTASSITSFRNCAFKYYCDKHNYPQLKVDDSAAFFGRTIHNIIHAYYEKIPDTLSSDDVLFISEALDQSFVESGNYITDQNKARVTKIKKNLIVFEQERLQNKEPKPTFLEKRIENVPIFPDLPPFLGIVDFYQQSTGRVIDWKTGKNGDIDDDRLIQGKIYELLLRAKGYPVKEVIFYNVELGLHPILPQVPEGYIYGVSKNVCDMIANDRFPVQPSYLCGWCNFRLSCEFRFTCPWR